MKVIDDEDRRPAAREPTLASMKVSSKRVPTALLTAISAMALLYTQPAYAYFDPNLGGLLFQIFAPLLALLVAFWGRVKFLCGLIVAKLRGLLSRKR